jgi:hypothetical protein
MSAMSSNAREGIGFGGFAARFLFAVVLVYATYNPTGYSYFHWVAGSFSDEIQQSSWLASPALKFVVGVVLAIGWVIYSTAARRSLGGVGVFLVVALCAGVIWLLIDRDVFSLKSVPALTHVALLVISAVLAVGMAWSHVRRRMTGQVDTDEVETH